MRSWIAVAVACFSVAVATEAAAQTPNTSPTFRPGANHHLGDEGFAAATGRRVGPGDEKLRTALHLAHVRRLLGDRTATRPQLAARRAELLGYLDEYIAAGATPENTRLPFRTPVFIDAAGRICAVGYLIERSVGRDVAERIAASHRYAYLEEIAAALPEARAWVATSGFSLEELASIQPGYEGPEVERYEAWAREEGESADGPFERHEGAATSRGTLTKGLMEGLVTKTNEAGVIVGSGTFVSGAGTWRSTYGDGTVLAEGTFAKNRPHGRWRFFHPSGRLAATGRFRDGKRHGEWVFYYDDAALTPIAAGRFQLGSIRGTWTHFDAHGKLLAISHDATPASWATQITAGGFQLDIVPGADGVRHRVHQGSVQGDHHRLDALVSADGAELLYVQAGSDAIYDATGARLERVDGVWHTSPCGWSRARRERAAVGDIAGLHGLIYADRFEPPTCGPAHPVGLTRARRVDATFASVAAMRAVSPELLRQIALGETVLSDAATPEGDDAEPDAVRRLAETMTWYIEWPHINGRFVDVFATLAGYPLG